jgi:hypothetical protein
MQHRLGTLADLVGLLALRLLQRVVLVQRSHAQTQVAFEENIGVVRGDDVAVLGDQAVGQRPEPGMLVPMDNIL